MSIFQELNADFPDEPFLFCCDTLIAFVFWAMCVVNYIRIQFGIKPGMNPPFKMRGMLVFMPSRLTQDGLAARRCIFIGLIGFAACIGAAVVLQLIQDGEAFK